MTSPSGNADRLEKRHEERDARFSGEYSCFLMPTDDEGRSVKIRPLDVSRRGLGFMVREPLQTGGFFWLVIGTKRFRVELAYCNAHLGIEKLFRAGLFLREPDGDLRMICLQAGLLADDHRRLPRA